MINLNRINCSFLVPLIFYFTTSLSINDYTLPVVLTYNGHRTENLERMENFGILKAFRIFQIYLELLA